MDKWFLRECKYSGDSQWMQWPIINGYTDSDGHPDGRHPDGDSNFGRDRTHMSAYHFDSDDHIFNHFDHQYRI